MPRNLKNRGFWGSWAVGSDTFCSIFREQSKPGHSSKFGSRGSFSTRDDSVTGFTTVVQLQFGHRTVLQF